MGLVIVPVHEYPRVAQRKDIAMPHGHKGGARFLQERKQRVIGGRRGVGPIGRKEHGYAIAVAQQPDCAVDMVRIAVGIEHHIQALQPLLGQQRFHGALAAGFAPVYEQRFPAAPQQEAVVPQAQVEKERFKQRRALVKGTRRARINQRYFRACGAARQAYPACQPRQQQPSAHD